MTKSITVLVLMTAFLLLCGGSAVAVEVEELKGSYLVQMPAESTELTMLIPKSARVVHRYASGRMNLRGLTDHEVENLRMQGVVVIPDFELSIQGGTIPWSLDRIDQRSKELDGLYMPPTRGEGVFGCFIDSGILPDPQLVGKVVPGVNLVSREPYPSWDTTDRNGHGHRMAGLFVTEAFGAAPDAKIIPVRVAGTDGKAWASEILLGVEWCQSWHENNGRPPMVINMSLGGPGSSFVSPELAAARAAGILLVVAACNFNQDAAGFWPANDPNVFVVAANDKNDARVTPASSGSWGSNFGSIVDVFAPGLDVPSFFGEGGGTSTATALTSGVAAVYLSERPTLSVVQLEYLLRARATGVVQVEPGTPNRLVYVGSQTGQPNCYPDTDTMCLGAGRFHVEVEWWTGSETGIGKVAPAGTSDSGLFWFFSSNNWELLVKVLDGCAINDHFWVLSGATTDVGYKITVTDTSTGAMEMYTNGLGHPGNAVNDIDAFPCN